MYISLIDIVVLFGMLLLSILIMKLFQHSCFLMNSFLFWCAFFLWLYVLSLNYVFWSYFCCFFWQMLVFHVYNHLVFYWLVSRIILWSFLSISLETFYGCFAKLMFLLICSIYYFRVSYWLTNKSIQTQ